MKVIVGLGNPGREYTQTRHNIGFRVVAELAQQYAVSRPRAKFQGEYVEARLGGVKAILATPLNYMNNSGGCVRAIRDFYKLPNEDLLVVCDDFNLDLTKLRFRARGSSGGQRGLQDIISKLGGEEFARLRVGIGPLPERWDAADFVLGKFTKHDEPAVESTVRLAADAVADWCREGVAYCMNRYN